MEKNMIEKKVITETVEKKLPLFLEFERPNGKIEIVYDKKDEKSEKARAVKDIIFTQDDNKRVSLVKDLGLPPDFKFFELQGYWNMITKCYPVDKKINFSKMVIAVDDETGKKFLKEFLEVSRTLYAALHEIGHSLQPYKWFEELEELEGLIIDDRLPEEVVEKYNGIILETERYAHNFAIKKLRRLRKDGIDLEPSLKTLGDIGRFVHAVMLGYKKG